MDSITQAALGASLAGAVAGKTLGRTALLVGAGLGTLPDLDVLIDYGTAIANFSEHRGFTHSLLVLIPLSFVLAWALQRWKPQVGYPRWLALTALVLVTHPLLDAFTTYGTQIFWPFGTPVAISSIFIIDPLYTLPLLLGLLMFLIRGPQGWGVTAGLAVSTLYLGWTLVGQQLITERVAPVLADAGLEEARPLVQPMPFNTLLWRVTAQNEETRIEIITGFLDGDTPVTAQYFPRQPELARIARQSKEAQRLEWFTNGFVNYDLRGDVLTATDIRLGVPGAHPFVFALGNYDNQTLTPLPSTQLPRPEIRRDMVDILWQRMTGQATDLCLATLTLPPPGQSCS